MDSSAKGTSGKKLGGEARGAPPSRARGWARARRIFSLGHSTRERRELVAILRSFRIAIVADIRSMPRSRHVPWFDRAVFARALERSGILYVHLARLGGLRRGLGERSPNAAWRNASFRGYADYMQTAEFDEGIEELRRFALEGRVALLCAEAVPWRCHRSLVADALGARGVVVSHVSSRSQATPHRLTPFADVEGMRVT